MQPGTLLKRARRALASPFSRSALRSWRHTAANRGWHAVPGVAFGRLLHALRRPAAAAGAPAAPAPPAGPHPFDLEYGVDTSGLIWAEQLPSGSRNDLWNTAYYGTPPSVFQSAIARLPEALRHSATFIDMGSGKGRALLMAAQAGFPRAIGVELSPQLHRIATDNVQRYLARTSGTRPRIETLQQDASLYTFPDGPVVAYFFHPFCRPVFEQVIGNLLASLRRSPRPAAIVYVNPQLQDVLDREAALTRIWNGPLAMDSTDLAADQIGADREECAIYLFQLFQAP